jgi:hypothetical protein
MPKKNPIPRIVARVEPAKVAMVHETPKPKDFMMSPGRLGPLWRLTASRWAARPAKASIAPNQIPGRDRSKIPGPYRPFAPTSCARRAPARTGVLRERGGVGSIELFGSHLNHGPPSLRTAGLGFRTYRGRPS